DWCDYLIVLLSLEAVKSEMVLAEIRRAYRRQKDVGRPRFIPIRVRNTDELAYELDAYLGGISIAVWNEEADSAKLLTELRAALAGTATEFRPKSPDKSNITGTNPTQITGARPSPACDPRLLRRPGGTIKLSDPFYLRRPVDDEAEAAAMRG